MSTNYASSARWKDEHIAPTQYGRNASRPQCGSDRPCGMVQTTAAPIQRRLFAFQGGPTIKVIDSKAADGLLVAKAALAATVGRTAVRMLTDVRVRHLDEPLSLLVEG